MPRPRLRLRTLLIAVAVIALTVGGARLARRRAEFLDRAETNAKWEAWFLQSAVGWNPDEPPSADVAAEMRRIAARYGALREKYERAARFPWLSVQPDPPPD